MELGVIIVFLGILCSIVLSIVALITLLKKAQGTELILWIVGLFFVPFIAPIAALIYFRNKPAIDKSGNP